MVINILVSVDRGSKRGNEITAERWTSFLKEHGHTVSIVNDVDADSNAELLIAIHAVKCQPAIQRFKTINPDRAVFVCLSGTDLHGVFEPDSTNPSPQQLAAENSLDLADRIILLEPMGQAKIPKRFHNKCTVIHQSAEVVEKEPNPKSSDFTVSVLGHLREVKDPLQTAMAARLLPDSSNISIVHVGKILEPHFESLVELEMKNNERYRWVGLLDHQAALQVLVQSQLTVLSSIAEGAPSVISEAIVNGIPVLATRIDGAIGLLGADYAGLFDVGNTNELASLLVKAESDFEFLEILRRQINERKHLFTRKNESNALKELVESF